VLDSGRPRPAFDVPEVPSALAFSADDESLLVGLPSGRVLVLDAQSGRVAREIAVGERPIVGLGAAEDGQLAAADAAGDVHAIAPDAQRAARVAASNGPADCVVWSRDGRGLVLGSRGGDVALLDVETGQRIEIVRTAGAVEACARSPRADRLLAASASGVVVQRVLDLRPLFMAMPPIDPLDPRAAAPEQWRGLEPDPIDPE
jgi:WD40 repeat protein